MLSYSIVIIIGKSKRELLSFKLVKVGSRQSTMNEGMKIGFKARVKELL